MLSRDSCLTMSSISNIAFASKRKGFRLPKPYSGCAPNSKVYGYLIYDYQAYSIPVGKMVG